MLLKLVEVDLLRPQLARIEPPAFALVVFITVQAASWNPLPILKRSFVHRRDARLLLCCRPRGKRDPEALANPQKLIRPGGHDHPIAALRVTAKDLVQLRV